MKRKCTVAFLKYGDIDDTVKFAEL